MRRLPSLLPSVLAAVLLTGCAWPLLAVGVGIQGAVSAGSDVVSGLKWWEDRKFQAEANKALQAQAEEIKKLREEIWRLNRAYFIEDRTDVSEDVRDSLKQELITLEKEFPDLITKDSPTQRVGAPLDGTGSTVTNKYAIFSDAGLNRFDGNGTHVFELPADATGNVTVATGRVPILVGGALKYLRYFDD